MTLAFQGYAIATTAASSSAATSVSGRRQGSWKLRRQAGSGSRGERECRADRGGQM